MSRFSRKEAEKKGWAIVHEDKVQRSYRAEKIYNGVLVNQAAASEGKLLEAIAGYEAHIDSLQSVEPLPVDEPNVLLDEEGNPVLDEEGNPVEENLARTVLVPDGSLTEEEWAARGKADAIQGEDGTVLYGPTEQAVKAQEAIHKLAQDAENDAKAQPVAENAVQIETQSGDKQLEDVLVVREGDEGLADARARMTEQSAQQESDRAEAGQGIGPHGPDNPMGGPPEFSSGQPGNDREPTEEEAARDRALVITPEADELAKKNEVDLSQVQGTGKDDKILKSDVESHLEEQK